MALIYNAILIIRVPGRSQALQNKLQAAQNKTVHFVYIISL